ncbi:thioredoxin-like protein [Crucibulum laeve]|uniref:Thioredoxin-like protein n=1 Tax=Crucibulum laeve TaxID=68775 RepID=A0A5C3MSJ2_9AGAR|nr:thioredoxin-like protein [Crucibulum laeve]
MSSASASPSCAPMRKRRFVVLGVVLLGLIFIFGVRWELPSSLKDAGISSLSRANVVQIVKSANKTKTVDEIYGLLHLVTEDDEHQHVLSNVVDLDPREPIPMSVYAAGREKLDWNKRVAELNEKHPVIVFSKSYCPYSMRAKQLLETYDLQPPPKIVEVDLRDDGNVLKSLLTRLTGHSTFPNIVIRGKSLGGSDNLQELHASYSLVQLLDAAGVSSKFSRSSD